MNLKSDEWSTGTFTFILEVIAMNIKDLYV